MKRGLEEVSAQTLSPKKAKTTSNGEGSVELQRPADEGEQWTKVEKKKKKKISKVESKMDVCTSFLMMKPDIVLRFMLAHLFRYTSSFLFRTIFLMTTYYFFNPQNAYPRFMYSNTEIVKRHHAIAIDVSRNSTC